MTLERIKELEWKGLHNLEASEVRELLELAREGLRANHKFNSILEDYKRATSLLNTPAVQKVLKKGFEFIKANPLLGVGDAELFLATYNGREIFPKAKE